ncbi:hypothetical protein AVEN_233167-1 [Araneus ventricosus]|uniref:SOCS box domain-containing protein n=1 Tax=Araneus ventricosus TaxID=182803 RepID=A0A4Y2EHK7_ARAVE|nr:hypothetical protein AVEN_233167-1 [Araneus ventricosus]
MIRKYNESRSSYIIVNDTKDVVKYSFVLHKSVDHLDLNLCEYSSFKRKTLMTKRVWDNQVFVENNFVCTEESCRKNLSRNRRLLYKLHLDVSEELESSLRNGSRSKYDRYHSCGILLNEVSLSEGYHERLLNQIITDLLRKTRQRVKLIRNILKIMKFIALPVMHVSEINRCFKILRSNFADTKTVQEFSANVCLNDWKVYHLTAENVDFLLHHADRTIYNKEIYHLCRDWVNNDVPLYDFEYAAPLLKYYDSPKFCETAYNFAKRLARSKSNVSYAALETPVRKGWITKERNLLMLQIFQVFFCDEPFRTSGSEALRLVWRSIPDAFITFDELNLTYGRIYGESNIEDIHEFYEDIIEEKVRCNQPRKLKDYCRTTIRKTLCDNAKLPEGINQLGLAPLVQSFLKLECSSIF